MKKNSLIVCAGCANKQKSEKLGKGEYYCKVVDGIIPSGIITFDIDATKCIRDGVFKRVKE